MIQIKRIAIGNGFPWPLGLYRAIWEIGEGLEPAGHAAMMRAGPPPVLAKAIGPIPATRRCPRRRPAAHRLGRRVNHVAAAVDVVVVADERALGWRFGPGLRRGSAQAQRETQGCRHAGLPHVNVHRTLMVQERSLLSPERILSSALRWPASNSDSQFGL